jgi:hypothetical protein
MGVWKYGSMGVWENHFLRYTLLRAWAYPGLFLLEIGVVAKWGISGGLVLNS